MPLLAPVTTTTLSLIPAIDFSSRLRKPRVCGFAFLNLKFKNSPGQWVAQYSLFFA